MQIRQFWITDLASFFPLVIQNFSLLNDKICSLPLRKFFQCKSNKNNLDAIYFPLRMIECLKSNGSSARGIRPPIIIMLSCNSSFKDNILQFDGTVYVVLSEQYWSGKDLTCGDLQMVLMPSSKSFGNKYKKSVSVFAAFFIYPIYFKFYYPCNMSHQFISRRIRIPMDNLVDWLTDCYILMCYLLI